MKRYRVEIEDKDYGWDYIIVDAENEGEIRVLYDNEIILSITDMEIDSSYLDSLNK